MPKLLTISAHPDDEVLAVGGTIVCAVARGCEVHAVVITDGREGYAIDMEEGIKETRRNETIAAHQVLGVAETVFVGEEELILNRNKKILKNLVKLIRQVQPSVVMTHYQGDPHLDHKDTHELVANACILAGMEAWPDLALPWRNSRLYTFEVLRSLLPSPTHFVDISDYMQTKMEAVAQFRSQIQRNSSMVSMVERIAEYRGAQIGSRYAEAFTKEFPLPCIGFDQL